MYVRIVRNCKIKIKDFSLFIIRNHLSLHLLPLLLSLSQVKPTHVFFHLPSTWVIDFGAIDHMTCNSSLFTTFQSHFSPSTVTLSDGSTSCVLGLETIHLTPLITLTFVMSLPQFSFNLISVSKFTRTHHCNISFFPNHCLIQDLLTKRIIGRGRESRVSTSLKQMCQSLLLVLELLPHLNYIVS